MNGNAAQILIDDDQLSAENAQKDLFLTFHIGQEDFGIDIGDVIEIVGIQKITEIPDMPDYIRGVINLRGKVISVMDVRLRFNMEQREYDDRTCVIVVTVGDLTVGLLVDRVNEVVEIAERQIEAAPPTRSDDSYIKGLGKIGTEVKILLDVASLVKNYHVESEVSD